MEKCELCRTETDELYECDKCGRLVCADCGGKVFVCDNCFDEEEENKSRFGCLL